MNGDFGMRKVLNVQDSLVYFLVTSLSHIVGMFLYMIVEVFLGGLISALPAVPRYIFGFIIYIPLIFVFCLLGVFLYFRKAVPKCYNDQLTYDDRWKWVKICLSTILPGELLRGLIFTLNIGFLQVTGCLGVLEAFAYERGYLFPQARHSAVTQLHSYIPMDYIAAALCFILVNLIYVPLVVFLFRHFWKCTEKAKK